MFGGFFFMWQSFTMKIFVVSFPQTSPHKLPVMLNSKKEV